MRVRANFFQLVSTQAPPVPNPCVRAASARFREKQRENQQDRLEEIMTLVRRFLNDESGATAIEYGLIAGLVAVAIIAALTALGSSLNNLFSDISDTVNASAS